MKIVACKYCGVLLDGDVVPFADPDDFDGFPIDKFSFTDGEWRPFIVCPVCSMEVTE